jgi:hypothetical protein
MSSDFVVICHYYNEQYMLAWWLKHHYQLFDHGVLIDYGSTDQSNELIRELAPTWEIRKSRNKEFDIESCEREVMEIEREFGGWKTVLNTTEFLFLRNKDDFLDDLKKSGELMFRANGIIMADPLGYYKVDPMPKIPLNKQRFHGFVEKEKHSVANRDRFIHMYPDGAYHLGRHGSNHPYASNHPDAFVLWFGFSPWSESMIQRKLFIQTRIPKHNQEKGLGIHHFVDRKQLETMYSNHAVHSEDLRLRKECSWIFL